jgi:hypothetical protein
VEYKQPLHPSHLPSLPPSFPGSMHSLSLSHTHTHAHTRLSSDPTPSLACLSLAVCVWERPCLLPPSLTLKRSESEAPNLLSLIHTHIHSLTHTHSLTHSQTHSLTHIYSEREIDRQIYGAKKGGMSGLSSASRGRGELPEGVLQGFELRWAPLNTFFALLNICFALFDNGCACVVRFRLSLCVRECVRLCVSVCVCV